MTIIDELLLKLKNLCKDINVIIYQGFLYFNYESLWGRIEVSEPHLFTTPVRVKVSEGYESSVDAEKPFEDPDLINFWFENESKDSVCGELLTEDILNFIRLRYDSNLRRKKTIAEFDFLESKISFKSKSRVLPKLTTYYFKRDINNLTIFLEKNLPSVNVNTYFLYEAISLMNVENIRVCLTFDNQLKITSLENEKKMIFVIQGNV